MVATNQPDTEQLLEQASRGDVFARQELLGRYRTRLRRMVAVRMDRRLSARVDPSDVVQESLVDAAQELSDYLRRRPLPFYAWLRQFAWERLLKLNRRHIQAQKRSVTREETLDLPDESAIQLARRLMSSGTSPSRRLIRGELRQRVQAAMAALPPRDREVLAMRVLEQMSAAEVAAVLQITERAAKARYTRALERLRALLDDEDVGQLQ